MTTLETQKRKTFRTRLNFGNGIVRATAWSVALYRAETWTMTQNHRKKIEAKTTTHPQADRRVHKMS